MVNPQAIEAGLALQAEMIEAGLDALYRAVHFGDPKSEVLVRAKDLIEQCRTLALEAQSLLTERDEAREKAIEECARVSESQMAKLLVTTNSLSELRQKPCNHIATAIRALKQPATTIVQDGQADDSR